MQYVTSIAIIFCMVLIGCGGTGSATNGDEGANSLEEIDPNISLREQISRLPGVHLNDQGQLRIRGSAGPPLVVIDGMQTMTADLSGINPSDVDQIEVMKGPETSIYGARGGNGVIVITTKRGRSDSN